MRWFPYVPSLVLVWWVAGAAVGAWLSGLAVVLLLVGVLLGAVELGRRYRYE